MTRTANLVEISVLYTIIPNGIIKHEFLEECSEVYVLHNL